MAKQQAKKKSNLFVWLGLGAAAVVAFLAIKKPASVNLTPKDKFLADAFNPATEWGAEVKNWLTTGGRQYTNESIKSVVAYHIANTTPQYQKYL